jgi:hypothetical protein
MFPRFFPATLTDCMSLCELTLSPLIDLLYSYNIIMIFNIGVAYSSTNSSSSGAGGDGNQSFAKTKHWTLIAYPSRGTDLRIELGTPDRKTIDLHIVDLKVEWPSYLVAVYDGDRGDFDRVFQHHPMRMKGLGYSAFGNNCQHFVASFVLLLEAYAIHNRSRTFARAEHYDRVMGALETDGSNMWHKENIYMAAIHGVGVYSPAGLVAGGASVASEAVVSAGGIAGFFGATSPAWFAPIAAVAAPVVGFGGGIAAVVYIEKKKKEWKEASKYPDYRKSGFPTEYSPSITYRERC